MHQQKHERHQKPVGLAKDDEDVRVQSTNDEATIARACVSPHHHHHRTTFFLFPLSFISLIISFLFLLETFENSSPRAVQFFSLTVSLSLLLSQKSQTTTTNKTTVRARPRVTYRTTFGLYYSSTRNTLAETNRCTTWALFTESRTCGKRSSCF
jgi:hypothetical protein